MRTYKKVNKGASLEGYIKIEITPLFSRTDTLINIETLTIGISLKVIESSSH